MCHTCYLGDSFLIFLENCVTCWTSRSVIFSKSIYGAAVAVVTMFYCIRPRTRVIAQLLTAGGRRWLSNHTSCSDYSTLWLSEVTRGLHSNEMWRVWALTGVTDCSGDTQRVGDMNSVLSVPQINVRSVSWCKRLPQWFVPSVWSPTAT